MMTVIKYMDDVSVHKFSCCSNKTVYLSTSQWIVHIKLLQCYVYIHEDDSFIFVVVCIWWKLPKYLEPMFPSISSQLSFSVRKLSHFSLCNVCVKGRFLPSNLRNWGLSSLFLHVMKLNWSVSRENWLVCSFMDSYHSFFKYISPLSLNLVSMPR